MNTYYNPDDLAKFPTIGEEAPELWDAFLKYYGPVMAEGALTAREKALIALAVAHSEMCPYCIDSYTQTLLEMGVDEEENDRSCSRCSGYESWNYIGSWRADEKTLLES